MRSKGFVSRDVDRDEFGDDWPFVVPNGVLSCEPGDVPTFTSNGNTIGLQDTRLKAPVWAQDATQAQAARLRDAALALCDER